jgi:hypothetical protein
VGLGVLDDGGFSRVSDEVTDRKLRAQRLDETLEILELAWRGEPFSYEGKHHTVKDLVFQPVPVQKPRIPIWVVAPWPAPRSMNRAIRWDGVVPSLRESPFEPLKSSDVADIAAWIREHRNADGPFEIVLEGMSPDDDPKAATAKLAPLAEAGATWWIESRWEAPHNAPEALLERIKQGPPRI